MCRFLRFLAWVCLVSASHANDHSWYPAKLTRFDVGSRALSSPILPLIMSQQGQERTCPQPAHFPGFIFRVIASFSSWPTDIRSTSRSYLGLHPIDKRDITGMSAERIEVAILTHPRHAQNDVGM